MNLILPKALADLSGLIVAAVAIPCGITPHELWIPAGCSTPCLAVHGGQVAYADQACQVTEFSAMVNLIGFTPMEDDSSAALVGELGGYALVKAATHLLLAGAETIDGIQGCEVVRDYPTTMFEDAKTGQWTVRVMRTLLYTIQRDAS